MAEALVGGAFLSASLQVLFDRMASRDFMSFILGRKHNDRLLKKLKITLLALKAVLDDAEEKQLTNSAVNDWLNELQYTVNQAEDLLDEIATKALQSKLEAELQSSQNQVQGIISTSTYNLSNEGIESRVEEIVDMLEYFLKQKDILGLKEDVRKKQWQRPPTTSLVDESGVYGRDDDKEKIIELLLSDDTTRKEIDVIPIVGMGGVGKTTLAQLLYNDARVDQNFDMKAWVCISDEFDVSLVTKKMFEAVFTPDNVVNDLNQIQIKLKEGLTGKKVLLILDDVWNDNYMDWDLLRRPFGAAARKSKIIVTTRMDSVASIMGTVSSHHLQQLPVEDCWMLFAKHAFENGNYTAHPELERIGKDIVKKCKGLPLAVKSLGGLLRSKLYVEEWESISKSEIWDLQSNILPALRLSYHYLPSHLKRCFAYCSTFPKDHEFEKEKLVKLWMAQDFVQQPKNNKLLENEGNDYFCQLLSRCFFQRLSGTNSKFVMHDLIHELTQDISREFCFRLEDDNPRDISKKVCHFSYFGREYDAFKKFKVINEVKHLRSFISFRGHLTRMILSNRVLCDLLPNLKSLRVLCLSYYFIFELPESIGNLIHLRYLDLSETHIKRLPDSITMLCNLQTLYLSYCRCLTELPVDMGKLVNLRYLDIRKTRLAKMPVQMSRLKCLQHLTYFIVGKHSGSKIGELREFCHLQELSILGLENVTNGADALEAKLKDKQQLEKLGLEWGRDTDDSENARDVLDNLQPHTRVKDLSIINYGGTRFPDWLGARSFGNIVSLRLERCAHCYLLPRLGQLPSLKHLSIREMEGIMQVGREFYGDASLMRPFQSLESLSFEKMPEWVEWYILGAGEFSRLLELSIMDCPKLTGELPNHAHLPSLRKLTVSRCQLLQSIQVELLQKHAFSELEVSNKSNTSNFVVCQNSCLRTSELAELHHLQKAHSIPGLKNMRQLKKLMFKLTGITNDSQLEKLQHCTGVKDLSIRNYGGTIFSDWLRDHSFCNIVFLCLDCCGYCCLLPPIGQIPSLKHLTIEAMKAITKVGPEFYGNASLINPFQSLETLCFKEMPEWEEWHVLGAGEFSRLLELSIVNCPKLTGELYANHFPSLRMLRISGCQKLQYNQVGLL